MPQTRVWPQTVEHTAFLLFYNFIIFDPWAINSAIAATLHLCMLGYPLSSTMPPDRII